MYSHSHSKNYNYDINHLYQVISDIENYPKFIPWCYAIKILSQADNVTVAEVVVKYKTFYEKYTCNIMFFPVNNDSATIEVSLISGPFSHLYNKWHLTKTGENSTNLEFQIEFCFKSALIEKLMAFFFNKAVSKLTESFEKRVKELYDNK